MSMIKDNERLAFAVMPSPEHDPMSYMIRAIGDIQDGCRKEMQDDWSNDDKLRAEGVRATCKTLSEFLEAYRDGSSTGDPSISGG